MIQAPLKFAYVTRNTSMLKGLLMNIKRPGETRKRKSGEGSNSRQALHELYVDKAFVILVRS